MVNLIPLCTVLTVCYPFTNTVTDSINGKQSTFTVVDSKPKFETVVEGLLTNPLPRNEAVDKMLEEFEAYLLQQEELRRQEEIKRQEEIQRQLEAERLRLEEEERKRELSEYPNKDYRQTYYSVVQDSETNLGSGYNHRSQQVKNIDNVMHFYDEYYGYLPVYAVNLDEVLASGFNTRGTPNLYGSVISVTDGENEWKGIILDACGACRYMPKIDLWVYENESALDISNLDYKYIRYGWTDYVTD